MLEICSSGLVGLVESRKQSLREGGNMLNLFILSTLIKLIVDMLVDLVSLRRRNSE